MIKKCENCGKPINVNAFAAIGLNNIKLCPDCMANEDDEDDLLDDQNDLEDELSELGLDANGNPIDETDHKKSRLHRDESDDEEDKEDLMDDDISDDDIENAADRDD